MPARPSARSTSETTSSWLAGPVARSEAATTPASVPSATRSAGLRSRSPGPASAELIQPRRERRAPDGRPRPLPPVRQRPCHQDLRERPPPLGDASSTSRRDAGRMASIASPHSTNDHAAVLHELVPAQVEHVLDRSQSVDVTWWTGMRPWYSRTSVNVGETDRLGTPSAAAAPCTNVVFPAPGRPRATRRRPASRSSPRARPSAAVCAAELERSPERLHRTRSEQAELLLGGDRDGHRLVQHAADGREVRPQRRHLRAGLAASVQDRRGVERGDARSGRRSRSAGPGPG